MVKISQNWCWMQPIDGTVKCNEALNQLPVNSSAVELNARCHPPTLPPTKKNRIYMATHYFGCSWLMTWDDNQVSQHHTPHQIKLPLDAEGLMELSGSLSARYCFTCHNMVHTQTEVLLLLKPLKNNETHCMVLFYVLKHMFLNVHQKNKLCIKKYQSVHTKMHPNLPWGAYHYAIYSLCIYKYSQNHGQYPNNQSLSQTCNEIITLTYT